MQERFRAGPRGAEATPGSSEWEHTGEGGGCILPVPAEGLQALPALSSAAASPGEGAGSRSGNAG